MKLFSLLMMLAAAAPQDAERREGARPSRVVATAAVTIVSAEQIADPLRNPQSSRRDRQVRVRQNIPLVEFF